MKATVHDEGDLAEITLLRLDNEARLVLIRLLGSLSIKEMEAKGLAFDQAKFISSLYGMLL